MIWLDEQGWHRRGCVVMQSTAVPETEVQRTGTMVGHTIRIGIGMAISAMYTLWSLNR